ncbi:recombinase family protein [Pseudomonas putida]|uniref:recombinase family protein n=1 Tax=Pseudomonas putida TaxID=303 RepID=UPI00236474F4|nr:recombinase family protein [Pseudomonas putida]MDD2013296.1 recombinase family protein [Pseudomonas putida]HDS1774190.1 recombinase family protein [Pseudomonas putida]
MSRTFAYLRVSTQEQTTDNQAQAIKSRGYDISPKRIVAETISGAVPAMERPGFTKLLERMEDGDTLVVLKLDRLGRDTIDVTSTVRDLGAQGIRVISLDLGDIDLTSTTGKATMGIMAVIAEMERDRIRERTQEGLARAKAQGVKLGRPVADDVTEQVRQAREAGRSQQEVADLLGLSLRTVKRHCAKLAGE